MISGLLVTKLRFLGASDCHMVTFVDYMKPKGKGISCTSNDKLYAISSLSSSLEVSLARMSLRSTYAIKVNIAAKALGK